MTYSIILADPPWSFQAWSKNGKKSPERHYATMSIEEIRALPVSDISARDCALFLWATGPMLPEAFSVLEAWGFRFSTVAFVWVKGKCERNLFTSLNFEFRDQIGLGYWSRSQTEFVLLGVRGSPKRLSRSVRQVIFAPRTKHSVKPAEVRERIVALCGDLPRCELFAREEAPGWTCLGNEVGEKLDIRESLTRLAAP